MRLKDFFKITEVLRREIAEIRNACKAKEEQLKIQKDLANEAKKNDLMRSRSDSYTISSPIFSADQLPEINSVKETSTIEPEKEDELMSLESGIVEELTHDGDENLKEQESVHIDAPAKVIEEVLRAEEEPKTSIPNDAYDLFQPQFKSQLQDLIKNQKEEYLDTVNILKRRFLAEQQQLLQKLQISMQNMTSTPLQNVSLAPTEDEEFTEFQTCLQSVHNTDEDTTLTNGQERKEKAATIINAYARGYLVRRLLKTIYVQECIRNIQDTLQFISTLDQHKRKSDEIQDILLKTKLFQQLQGDLYRLYNIFFDLSTREKMKLISSDRERRIQKFKNTEDRFNKSFEGNLF